VRTFYTRGIMGQKYCKKINLEISPELHSEIKKQANDRNITIRRFILKYLLPYVMKNKEVTDDEIQTEL
jgi:predicted HicB family RNase H-like nuclease